MKPQYDYPILVRLMVYRASFLLKVGFTSYKTSFLIRIRLTAYMSIFLHEVVVGKHTNQILNLVIIIDQDRSKNNDSDKLNQQNNSRWFKNFLFNFLCVLDVRKILEGIDDQFFTICFVKIMFVLEKRCALKI